MQITLNQDEIHAAVEAYVRNQITIAPNQSVAIDFTAGRGPNGLSATLDIKAAPVAASKPMMRRSLQETPIPAPAAREVSEPEPEFTDEPENLGPAESEETGAEIEETGEDAPEIQDSPRKNPFTKVFAEPTDEDPDVAENYDEEASASSKPSSKKSIFSKAS